MRLLFDQNLSRRLVGRLEADFPRSAHVANLGLERASDETVWARAHRDGFAIVTEDADFNDLLTLYGAPPWVVWVRRGNCSTEAVAALLLRHREAIQRLPHSASALLELT